MSLMKLIILIHVVAGFVGLFVFPVVMCFAKGSKKHVRLGKIYFYSMLLSSSLGVIISIYQQDWGFLLNFFLSIMLLVSSIVDIRHKNNTGSYMVNYASVMIVGVLTFLLLCNQSYYKSDMPMVMSVLYCFYCLVIFALPLNGIILHLGKLAGSFFLLVTGFAVNSLQKWISLDMTISSSVVYVFIIFPIMLLYFHKKWGYK